MTQQNIKDQVQDSKKVVYTTNQTKILCDIFLQNRLVLVRGNADILNLN